MNHFSKCKLWSKGDRLLEEYHDHEWCKINHDDQYQFEMLCLEGASVGLSWKIIMHKREAYKKAFHNFNIDQCAKMSDDELEALLNNKDLIRNRSKIFGVRKNALVVKRIQEEYGSFDHYLWSFVDKQIVGGWHHLEEVPTSTSISIALAKDMKKRGMVYVGDVITYSFMQSIGLVNDHLVDCDCL